MTTFEKMLAELVEEYKDLDSNNDIYDIDEFETFNKIQTADFRRYRDAYNDYNEYE